MRLKRVRLTGCVVDGIFSCFEAAAGAYSVRVRQTETALTR